MRFLNWFWLWKVDSKSTVFLFGQLLFSFWSWCFLFGNLLSFLDFFFVFLVFSIFFRFFSTQFRFFFVISHFRFCLNFLIFFMTGLLFLLFFWNSAGKWKQMQQLCQWERWHQRLHRWFSHLHRLLTVELVSEISNAIVSFF